MLMEREAEAKARKSAPRRVTSSAKHSAQATHAKPRPASNSAPSRQPTKSGKAQSIQTASQKASHKQSVSAALDAPKVVSSIASDTVSDLDDLDVAELEAAEIDAPKGKREAITPKKRAIRWSFVIAGLAIIGAVIYLVIANTGSSAEYYMTISELRSCSSCQTQTVRVLGTVRPSSIVMNDATQTVTFVITQGAQSLPVTYGGVVPDTLKSGLQVVVEGRLINGVFHAQTLLVKCPSKFQAAPKQ